MCVTWGVARGIMGGVRIGWCGGCPYTSSFFTSPPIVYSMSHELVIHWQEISWNYSPVQVKVVFHVGGAATRTAAAGAHTDEAFLGSIAACMVSLPICLSPGGGGQ